MELGQDNAKELLVAQALLQQDLQANLRKGQDTHMRQAPVDAKPMGESKIPGRCRFTPIFLPLTPFNHSMVTPPVANTALQLICPKDTLFRERTLLLAQEALNLVTLHSPIFEFPVIQLAS